MLKNIYQGKTFPILVVVGVIIVLWYIFAVMLNSPWQLGVYQRAGVTDWTPTQFVSDTLNQDRPVLPSAQQVIEEIWKTTIEKPVTSRRSLVYHAWITLSATLLGFAIGTTLGIVLAISIVHSRAMDSSMMPWIVASQTIPIIAIAPMIIVVLNAVGISGLLPKALISAYLSFFPVAVGMVKGFRSPERISLDLMRTYAASQTQIFLKLRWPAALPYLFTSMKVAVAIALVGAIVGELPTGAVAGLGARLLSGSYYGQTVQIWSALFMAAALAASLVAIISLLERITKKHMGGAA
ncbi:Pyrimidine ABC transporter, transmembrane component 1 [hydrothermal vent metagenome]|uniref:Pyrimidine ABC transporter, transmembrane component 1 n=1 Tax=hydrothermal vent metagenome TaxID=652676 RepID=A0A3B0TM22_9ZZZZ